MNTYACKSYEGTGRYNGECTFEKLPRSIVDVTFISQSESRSIPLHLTAGCFSSTRTLPSLVDTQHSGILTGQPQEEKVTITHSLSVVKTAYRDLRKFTTVESNDTDTYSS